MRSITMVEDRIEWSGLFGWISIACWVVVYSPQIRKNYQLKSGEGLSLLFLYTWVVGDVCNVLGAVIGHLLPTVIILGVYYTFCDSTLIFQVYYYRWARKTGRIHSTGTLDAYPSEHSYLLEGRTSVGGEPRMPSVMKTFLQYITSVIFIIIAGLVACCISTWLSRGNATYEPSPDPSAPMLKVQILGSISAACYISARLPQIYANFSTRCKGLAPDLFFFTIIGNLTYTLSICAASMDRDYLIKNASWLASSTIVVVLDGFVLCQAFYYGFWCRQRIWTDEDVA